MRLAFIAAGAALLGLSPQGDGIIRLKPSDFRQLPAAVRRDLDRRDCRIPQMPDKTAPHADCMRAGSPALVAAARELCALERFDRAADSD